MSDISLLEDRAIRTDLARRKRGEKTYISKLNVSDIDECYVVNICGQKGCHYIVLKYGNRYVYVCDYFNETGTAIPSINVLTQHFIERYRERNNMYASPIKTVLYDILDNIGGASQTSSDSFECAVALNNGGVAPVVKHYTKYGGSRCLVNIFITYLDRQDEKVRELRNLAESRTESLRKSICIEPYLGTSVFRFCDFSAQ